MKSQERQQENSQFVLQPSDVQRMIEATSDFQDRIIIKTLWWLGLRASELVMLNVEDIDFGRRRVVVRNGKGNKTRIVPIIDDQYLLELKTFVGNQEAGAVFSPHGKTGGFSRKINASGGGVVGGSGIWMLVRVVAEHAGIINPNPNRKHVHPHLFRHSIARWLKSQGMSMEWVQNFLGHEQVSTTMDLYGTLSPDEMQRQAEQAIGDAMSAWRMKAKESPPFRPEKVF